MKRLFISWFAFIFICLGVTAQVDLKTVAEKSDFKSTSDYNDVMTFMNKLKKISPFIRTENIATSVEGREVPLMIIGNPLPKCPGDIIKDKRIVVYIQANIHAGEVEGKEATLMYVRDLLREKSPAILKNVVLLICPLFNPDGNEKISPLNRTYQNGPVNGVGVRYNGQFLDLNRDAMKAESPEVRGILTNVHSRECACRARSPKTRSTSRGSSPTRRDELVALLFKPIQAAAGVGGSPEGQGKIFFFFFFFKKKKKNERLGRRIS